MSEVLPAVPLLVVTAAYAAGVRRLTRRGDRWPARRVLATAIGLLALAVALLPPVATHDDDPHVHVVQHLLLAMLAPLLPPSAHRSPWRRDGSQDNGIPVDEAVSRIVQAVARRGN